MKLACLLVVLLTLLVGCETEVHLERKVATAAPTPESIRPRGYSTEYSIQTVEHDGHSYVIYDSQHGGALLHSPNCQCQKIEGSSRGSSR